MIMMVFSGSRFLYQLHAKIEAMLDPAAEIADCVDNICIDFVFSFPLKEQEWARFGVDDETGRRWVET